MCGRLNEFKTNWEYHMKTELGYDEAIILCLEKRTLEHMFPSAALQTYFEPKE